MTVGEGAVTVRRRARFLRRLRRATVVLFLVAVVLAVLRVGLPFAVYVALMMPAIVRSTVLYIEGAAEANMQQAEDRLRRRAAKQVAYEVALDRERRRRGVER